MARYRIVFAVEGKQLPSVKKKLADVLEALGVSSEEITASVEKMGKAESRSDRLQDIRDTIEEAANEVEVLKNEMQEWYDGMSANLLLGQTAEEVQEAIEALDTLRDELENVDFDSINFPGMF